MVQLMRSDNLSPGTDTASSVDKFPVKLEIEDTLEEEHGPLNKRSKLSSPSNQWSTESNEFPVPPSQFNPLDEPSPLGLRLRKSPSLLDLIQMRLSQGNASSVSTSQSENLNLRGKKDINGTTASLTTEKLKASNFSASLLRIGRWEYVSRYEGDLVAKCYFAKHKLVWEILDGGLKSKIEIQWSDIMALKADFPDNEPGTLVVVLSRQPLFFRETNPQPRKHTLWQATADFTDGEASIHRQHYLRCPPGQLNKQYEKLIQCDMRLNLLSQQAEIVLDSPYFEVTNSTTGDPDGSRTNGFNKQEPAKGSPISVVQCIASPATVQSSSSNIEQQDSLGTELGHSSQEAHSPSSVMDLRAIEGTGTGEGDGFMLPGNWEQFKVSGLRSSMSMSDIVNHIGLCISEQMTSGNPPTERTLECQDILENIAQILLGDTQFTTASDEKSLMSRVNSLCCLLQDPVAVPNSQVDGENHFEGIDEKSFMSRVNSLRSLLQDPITIPNGENHIEGMNEKSFMSRVNSLRSLLQDSAPVPNSLIDGRKDFQDLNSEGDAKLGHASGSVLKQEFSNAGDEFGAPQRDPKGVLGCKQAQGMSRKDSFGELLLGLPRITSLPTFLFDISEDSENQSS